MNKSIIYALDFDGVICDSAIETGITGWKAATRIWSDMQGQMAPDELVEKFRMVRPIIETGYEAILAMRLLFQDVSTTMILDEFSKLKQQTLMESGKDIEYLKLLFGGIRDTWIQENLDEWVDMNPLFPSVADKLRVINNQGLCYIVTTKQERFVAQILKASGIDLATDRIFGLDRKMSKVEVLTQLLEQHAHDEIHFVEDRLPTLINVLATDRLKSVKLAFATWGYNTAQDKLKAQNLPVKSMGLEDFLS